jgi:hypothetical protein
MGSGQLSVSYPEVGWACVTRQPDICGSRPSSCCGPAGPRRMGKNQSSRRIRSTPKAVLRLPDLDQAKSAVLNSLSSSDAQRGYRHAIDEFVEWYCSEPRLSFSKTVVLRYRIHLESRCLAPGTINLRLGAVRRLAYEAADCGLLSPNLAAGIRRVKGLNAFPFLFTLRNTLPPSGWLLGASHPESVDPSGHWNRSRLDPDHGAIPRVGMYGWRSCHTTFSDTCSPWTWSARFTGRSACLLLRRPPPSTRRLRPSPRSASEWYTRARASRPNRQYTIDRRAAEYA